MQKALRILYFLPLLTFFSCNGDGLCLSGEGGEETRELNLDDFEGVTANGSMHVVITKGTEQIVKVEGQPNILDELEVDVSGGVWDIRFKRCVRDTKPLKVYITLPQLNKVAVSGSGFIKIEDQFRSKEFEVNVSGSGDITGNVQADKVNSSISGSGTIELTGDAHEQVIRISGSGNHHAYDLSSEVTDIKISGSGKAQVKASNKLDVNISGSGRVHYKGNPKTNVSVSGSGKLIKD